MDHLDVLDAVKRAYLDLRDVYEHLSDLAIMALILGLAVSAIGFFLAGLGFATFSQLVRLVVHIGFGFVTAPYLIAVYRFILLGKVTTRYELELGDPRLQRFFGWTVVFALLSAAPAMLSSIVPLPGFFQGALALVLAIAALVVTVRLIVVLPAVAVDSDRVSWQNAMADTAGYSGRIFLICVGASLPVGLVAAVLSAFSHGFGLLAFIVMLIQGAVGVIIASLFAAIASRLYELLGDRVRA
jgi:hypothetical protein